MNNISLIILFVFFLTGCVETFNPPEIKDAETLLVIDASVNGETGRGTVRLRESVKLHEELNPSFSIGASVYVEDENNNIYEFQPTANAGEYLIENLNLDYSDKVRLNVMLGDGTRYQSEFVEYKRTPDIDSVTYAVENGSVVFYAFTHDPEEKSIYYKWDYEEAWEFNAAYYSSYEFEEGEVVPRDNSLELFICYQFDRSSNIVIGSSEKLQADVISEFPVARISAATGKFARRYSILIKQRALTKHVYEYWQMLKTNTESLGGLFDPQPSAINGNISNMTNPSEIVLGYFHVYSEKQQRVFINPDDIPFISYKTGYEHCQLDTLMVDEIDPSVTSYLLSSSIMGMGPFIIGYTKSTVGCMDCRVRGTSERPDYWN